MKKLLSACFMLAFVAVLFTSCSTESLNDDNEQTELATGKDEATSSGSESNELPDNSEE